MCCSPLAATPEFSILAHVTPFTFRGTISREIPLLPEPPVRTAVVQKSAQIPLVIHFLQPLTMYMFPILLAVVWIRATSEPATSHTHISLKYRDLLLWRLWRLQTIWFSYTEAETVFLLCLLWVGTPSFAAPFQSSKLEEVQLRFRHLDPIKRLCNLIWRHLPLDPSAILVLECTWRLPAHLISYDQTMKVVPFLRRQSCW